MKKKLFLVLVISFISILSFADDKDSKKDSCSVVLGDPSQSNSTTYQECLKSIQLDNQIREREAKGESSPKDDKKTCEDSYKERTKAMKDRTDDITKEKKDNRESIEKLTEDLIDLQKQLAAVDTDKKTQEDKINLEISRLKKSLSDESQQMVDQIQEIDVQLNELVTTKLNAVLADFSKQTSNALTECRAQAAKNAKVMYELIQKEAIDKRTGKYVARTTDRAFGGKSDMARIQDLATNGGTVEGVNFEGYNDCVASRQKTATDNRDLAISNLKSQEMSLKNKSQSLQNKLNTATGSGNEELAAKFKEIENLEIKAQQDKIDLSKKIAQKQEQIQKKQTITDVNNSGVDQATEDAVMACCECPRAKEADDKTIDDNASPSEKKKFEKEQEKLRMCKDAIPKVSMGNARYSYNSFCKANSPGKTKASLNKRNDGNQ